jgi:hypothetical protein
MGPKVRAIIKPKINPGKNVAKLMYIDILTILGSVTLS